MDMQPSAPNYPTPDWEAWSAFLQSTFGITLSPEQRSLFARLLEELVLWNEKMNLVSVRSADEILWRHFADSLAVPPLMERFSKGAVGLAVADIGTGAGFPGIPVKIARPDIRLTLVESITKKTSFLEHVIETLALTDTRVMNDRAEILGQDRHFRECFDIVLSRAVAKFSPNLEIALPLAKPGGYVLVHKTKSAAFGDEGLPSVQKALGALGGVHRDTFCYRLPNTEHEYCVLAIQKVFPTPPQYPRRVGVPEKKPL